MDESESAGDELEPTWDGRIDQVIVGGSLFMDEVLFYHRQFSTCLVCDLIQRHDPDRQTGWKGWLMRLDGFVGRDGSTPRERRLSFVNRARARAAAETALSRLPERLVIAQRQWVPTDGTAALRHGLRWVLPAAESDERTDATVVLASPRGTLTSPLRSFFQAIGELQRRVKSAHIAREVVVDVSVELVSKLPPEGLVVKVVRLLVVLGILVNAAALEAGEWPDALVRADRAWLQREDLYQVRLGSVAMVPERGFHSAAAARGEPFVVQFYEVPGAAQRSRFASAGIELLGYVGGGSYLARCRTCCSDAMASLPIRSTFDLTWTMKLAPVFLTDADLRARLRSSSRLDVVVRFQPWVSWHQARLILERCGASFDATGLGYRGTVSATVDPIGLRALLDDGRTVWIDPSLPATGPSLVDAAERSRVDQVRGAVEFLSVDGTGARVGVVDWFPEGIHPELAGRVTPVHVRWGEDVHGTTVSGCVASAGVSEPWATGMAPGSSLFWTSWSSDPWTAMERLHDNYGVSIVNNSWNTKPGWWLPTRAWHGDLWAFGYYHERADAADSLVRDSDLLIVFSAGNKRQVSFLGPHHHGDQYGNEDQDWHEDLHPLNPRFASIAGAAIAKNVLTVGGTTKDDNLDPFSSLGPTDDGRIKPDVVAVGLDVLTTGADDGYVVSSGTSISSAVVAGVAALLTDYSRRRHGRDPSSSVLKGLLVHSARDVDAPGPDYRSGFGMVDAELAARVLDSAVFDAAAYHAPRHVAGRLEPATPKGEALHNAGAAGLKQRVLHSLVIEGAVDHGEAVTFLMPVRGDCDELRATLVWHDPPGPELINDLDLHAMAPNGRISYPFVLDPEHPSAEASHGINHRDNVEQLRVTSPVEGWWRIVVDGSVVAQGPQDFALIVSAGEGNRAPETLSEGDLVIDDFFVTGDGPSVPDPAPWTVFRDNEPLNFYVEATILANADYGDRFGSIDLTVSVIDPAGDRVVRYAAAGHSSGPGPVRFLLAVGFEVPAQLPPGMYTAHAELAMHNGVRRTADFPFSVDVSKNWREPKRENHPVELHRRTE